MPESEQSVVHTERSLAPDGTILGGVRLILVVTSTSAGRG